VQLEKGDTYSTYPSGGGGWGNPLERDVEAVREDARNEIVSREAAQKIYGVVLEGDDYVINTDKTRALRSGR
jgi:N-methylhydantoinase B